MNTTAKLRGVRLSAQKGRLVADLIRGVNVTEVRRTEWGPPGRGATEPEVLRDHIGSVASKLLRVVAGAVPNATHRAHLRVLHPGRRR